MSDFIRIEDDEEEIPRIETTGMTKFKEVILRIILLLFVIGGMWVYYTFFQTVKPTP